MARYGHCSACNTSVWLQDDGSCPNGHGPEYISGVVDDAAPAEVVQPQPADAVEPPKKSNKTVFVVLGVIVALMLCGCGALLLLPMLGIGGAIAVPVFDAASGSAQEQSCYANGRTMEGALMQWVASDPANTTDAIYTTEDAMLVLVPDYIKVEPACPSGGWYEYDPYSGTFSCSEHGHY